ncbi:hypothetical protein B0H12DRAFT_1121836 [Mycena haematopus]|nr:hypothetical protein B0H12DRAFT_1121836 [Mycena haematopus]
MMLFFVALLPLLSAAAQTGASHRLRVARQTLGSTCTAPCDALSTSLGAGGTGGLAAICNTDVANNYVACFNCEVQIGSLTQQAGQQTVDSYTSGCSAAGHAVSSLTITASSAPVAGGASAADGVASAAAGAASAAAGAASAAAGDATAAAGDATAAVGGASAASDGSGSAIAGYPIPTGASAGSTPAESGTSSQSAKTGGAAQTSVSVLGFTTVLVFLACGMVI